MDFECLEYFFKFIKLDDELMAVLLCTGRVLTFYRIRASAPRRIRQNAHSSKCYGTPNLSKCALS